jgi:hypothetical protein
MQGASGRLWPVFVPVIHGPDRLIKERYMKYLKVLLVLFVLSFCKLSEADVIPVQGGGTLSFGVTNVERCNTANNPNFPSPCGDIFMYSNYHYSLDNITSSPTAYGVGWVETVGASPLQVLTPSEPNVVTLPLSSGCSITFVGRVYSMTTFKFTPESATLNCSYNTIYINPKYAIVGVVYAVPGTSSFTQYQDKTVLTNTVTTADSFAAANTQSYSTSFGVKFGGHATGSNTVNASGGLTQSESLAVTTTNSASTQTSYSITNVLTGKTPGVGNSSDNYYPSDLHDYDKIVLWLNPVVGYNVYSNGSVVLSSISFNTSDTNALDIPEELAVEVGYLNGHFGAMPPSYAQALARAWANNGINWVGGSTPAITSDDYPTIMAADPFSNPSYSLTFPYTDSQTSADGRFNLLQQGLLYQQADPTAGSTPGTSSYENDATTSITTSTTYDYKLTVNYGYEESASISSTYTTFSAKLQNQNAFTWTYSNTNSQQTQQTGTQIISLTGPTCNPVQNGTQFVCSPQYTGPTDLTVLNDNIYDTFTVASSGTIGTQNVPTGMTWTEDSLVKLGPTYVTASMSRVFCDNGVAGGCNVYQGDTKCTMTLPVLCVDPAGLARPNYTPEPSLFYDGWVGGYLGLSTPTSGTLLTSNAAANNVCSAQYGPGWRMAEFHDGGGGWGYRGDNMVDSYAAQFFYSQWPSLHNNPTPNYPISTPGRFWVSIDDQSANCWNPK